jgi:hypothetical protein
MAIAQPIASDKLSSPDHSLSHRVFANDTAAPVQSVTVASTGNVTIPENLRVEGDVDIIGNTSFLLPHGTFYSLATQSIASTTDFQVVAFEYEDNKELLVHSTTVNNSRIYVPTGGSYELVFSGICDTTTGTNKYIEIWPAIDGSDIPDSNTRVCINTSSVEMTVAVSYIFDMNANSYVELRTLADTTAARWKYTAAGTNPTRPATPSVIVTFKKISSYPV